MEDIPAELKSTQNRTISIFLEYVRNRSVLQKTSTEKQTMHCHSDSLPRVDASADHIESGVIEVVPPPSRRKRCIRRLQSEPHGETSQVRVVVENALETASELAETPDSEDGDQPLCSTAKSRPSTLSLSSAENASVSGPNKASDLSVKPSSPKHKRMPSNCESITTPVPDPPLFSPASVSALEATYPPARDYFSRSRSSSSPLPLPYDWQRHQVACASFEVSKKLNYGGFYMCSIAYRKFCCSLQEVGSTSISVCVLPWVIIHSATEGVASNVYTVIGVNMPPCAFCMLVLYIDQFLA